MQKSAHLLDLYATRMAVGKRAGLPIVAAACSIEPRELVMLTTTFLPPVRRHCLTLG